MIHNMNIYLLFQKGGIFMYPLLICSTIVLAIVLERCYYFIKLKNCPNEILNQVGLLVQQEKFSKAIQISRTTNCPVSQVITAGIEHHEKSQEERDKILFRIGSRELRRMSRNIRGLGIVAHVSPLIGLLGTVAGMIEAFKTIQELGGSVDPVVLAGGIWAALITTATGLTVAIPAMIFYHYFVGKIDRYYAQMKEVVQLLAEWLGETPLDFDESNENVKVKEDIEYGF
ncbi:MAG: MotA/TolQ/ExbB proton channel family protein [Firmicutes bacterium]|nr:MotA/TolQ/ExbB proton channel family protein [Bacillota bacterium]